ncbi:MAG: tetratricopeptide repeat protein, partial [Kiritimatiellia bacterium]|nr:tetratricopeptide repeat protein [Kiritimatiellia bacterium]
EAEPVAPAPVPTPAPAGPVASAPAREEAPPPAAKGDEEEGGDTADNDEGDPVSEPGEYRNDAHPESRYARQTHKALHLARAGHIERAREMIQSLLTIDPDDVAVREAMVKLNLDTGKTDEAEQLAGALLVDDPGNPYALYVKGSMDIVRGDYKGAEAKLTDSVAQRPHPESLNNLAWLLSEMGKHKEAEPFARKAVEMDPSVHHAWDTLGLILLKEKRVDESCDAFKRALKLVGDDIYANLNMADIRVRQGRLRAANKLLRHLETRQNEMLAPERKRFKALEIAAMKS